ncbi:hypothetical protein CEP20_01640 [Acinetobacter baumannii]|nr:hypothetical protein CEP20_01640 [Acinetobacter baumannii]
MVYSPCPISVPPCVIATEELYWQPQGPHAGRLFTHAPSTYKIPTSVDIPHIFRLYGIDGYCTSCFHKAIEDMHRESEYAFNSDDEYLPVESN